MMLIGVSEDYFWHSNPRKLAPYGELYRMKQFELDRMSHRMGAYVYEAVGTALANAFSKHSKVSYRDKPYSADEEERIKNERMTEEEKLEKVKEVFAMLSGEKR